MTNWSPGVLTRKPTAAQDTVNVSRIGMVALMSSVRGLTGASNTGATSCLNIDNRRYRFVGLSLARTPARAPEPARTRNPKIPN